MDPFDEHRRPLGSNPEWKRSLKGRSFRVASPPLASHQSHVINGTQACSLFSQMTYLNFKRRERSTQLEYPFFGQRNSGHPCISMRNDHELVNHTRGIKKGKEYWLWKFAMEEDFIEKLIRPEQISPYTFVISHSTKVRNYSTLDNRKFSERRVLQFTPNSATGCVLSQGRDS